MHSFLMAACLLLASPRASSHIYIHMHAHMHMHTYIRVGVRACIHACMGTTFRREHRSGAPRRGAALLDRDSFHLVHGSRAGLHPPSKQSSPTKHASSSAVVACHQLHDHLSMLNYKYSPLSGASPVTHSRRSALSERRPLGLATMIHRSGSVQSN